MAGVVERLQFLLTMDSSGAIKGFKNIGAVANQELGRAQTSMDRVAYTMTRVGGGSVAVAGVIGRALFNVASGFQTSALTAGVFADATRLSMEQASRWVEVAGDMNIQATDLQTAFTKMEKTLASSPQKFRDLGVEVARTSVGTVDAEGTFLNLVDRLNAIPDPALRAKTAADVLGRGWQANAELIAKGSGRIRQALASVPMSQVFSSEDRKKAEQMRKAMEDLGDAGEQLRNNLARGAVPIISQLTGVVSNGVSAFTRLNDVSNGSLGAFTTVATAALGAGGAMSVLVGQAIKVKDRLTTVNDAGSRVLTGLGKLTVGLAVVSAAVTVGTMAWSALTAKKREAAARTAEVTNALDDQVMTLVREKGAIKDVALGLQALSNVLTNTGEDGKKTTIALSQLGYATQNAAEVLIGLYPGGERAVEMLTKLGIHAGLTADQARELAAAIEATDDNNFRGKFAWMTPQFAAIASAMAELKDQAQKTDIWSTLSTEIDVMAGKSSAAQEQLKKIKDELKFDESPNDLRTLFAVYNQLAEWLHQTEYGAEGAADGVDTLASSLEELSGKTSSQIKLQDQLNESTVPAIALIKAQADAANYQAEQIKESNDAITEAVDVEAAYRAALVDTREDIKTYREELKKAGKDQTLVNAIVADHVKNQLEDAAAIAEGRLANMEYISTQDQAAAKSLLQAEALKKVVAQVGKNSPLGRGLQEVIALLEDIPEDVRIRIYAEMTANLGYNPMTTPNLKGVKVPRPKAAGGPVSAGDAYIVGEVGPELFVPGSSGTIVPNGALGAGPTFHINVNAGMGANGQAIGNEIVSALKAWVRTNGKIPGIAA